MKQLIFSADCVLLKASQTITDKCENWTGRVTKNANRRSLEKKHCIELISFQEAI